MRCSELEEFASAEASAMDREVIKHQVKMIKLRGRYFSIGEAEREWCQTYLDSFASDFRKDYCSNRCKNPCPEYKLIAEEESKLKMEEK